MQKIERNRMVVPVLLTCLAPCAAFAQTAYLDQSAVVGVGKTISISRLPTAQANGKISYYDGTITLNVSPAGVPSVSSSSFAPSAKLVTDHFQPGRYYVKVGGCATQFADVTEGVGHGGGTVWTLVLETAANCSSNYPNQATWQTGTPAPDVAARLNAAKVPKDPNYSYGLTEIGGGNCCGAFYASNGLLAVEQINNELELVSYTDINGNDQSSEVGSVILVECADKACSNAPM